jgi:hypothetical protein
VGLESRIDWTGVALDGIGIAADGFGPEGMVVGLLSDVVSLDYTLNKWYAGEANALDVGLEVASFVPLFGTVPDALRRYRITQSISLHGRRT